MTEPSDPTAPLLHLVAAADFDRDGTDPLAPDSRDPDGSLLCGTVDQIAGMARLLHAGTSDLLLLVIDPRRLEVDVSWQDPFWVGQDFPHVHGPIPREAIVEVVPFPPGPGGRWSRPVIAPLP